jgi:hypothetical protein
MKPLTALWKMRKTIFEAVVAGASKQHLMKC